MQKPRSQMCHSSSENVLVSLICLDFLTSFCTLRHSPTICTFFPSFTFLLSFHVLLHLTVPLPLSSALRPEPHGSGGGSRPDQADSPLPEQDEEILGSDDDEQEDPNDYCRGMMSLTSMSALTCSSCLIRPRFCYISAPFEHRQTFSIKS